ncbi:MAG: hypothetical protein ACHQQS_15135 [Thermoanaerobaculales bacterium]
MSVRQVALVVLVLTAIGLPARAEEKPITLQPSQTELNFNFAWQEGDWGNGITLSGRVGYLLTQHHEIGPIGSFIYSNPNQGVTYHGGIGGLFYRYNLSPYGRFVIPYAGLAYAYAFGDARQSERYVTEIEAGVRLMLSSSAAVNVGMVYERDRITYAQPDLQRTFAIVTGVSVFPGPLFKRTTSTPGR